MSDEDRKTMERDFTVHFVVVRRGQEKAAMRRDACISRKHMVQLYILSIVTD
ncbi:MAG: hypothetical protein JSW29_05390 [Candidatus Bathyarchaeota archaeon]|nr:MAG: hypothetical protein JSW29_05390 [Candidatus Bathyarchaeota archaeon]